MANLTHLAPAQCVKIILLLYFNARFVPILQNLNARQLLLVHPLLSAHNVLLARRQILLKDFQRLLLQVAIASHPSLPHVRPLLPATTLLQC